MNYKLAWIQLLISTIVLLGSFYSRANDQNLILIPERSAAEEGKFIFTPITDDPKGCEKIDADKCGGRDVGNGGMVLVCKDALQDPPVFVDYFEFSESTYKLDFGISDLNHPNDIQDERMAIDSVLNRLEKWDAARAQTYRRRVKEFYEKLNDYYLSSDRASLTYTNDANLRKQMDCSNGSKAEAAVAINQMHPSMLKKGDPQYIVYREIWQQLKPYERAGLVLHEVVYTDAILSDKINSDGVRHFTFLISSSYMNDPSNKSSLLDLALRYELGDSQGIKKIIEIPVPDSPGVKIPVDVIMEADSPFGDAGTSHIEGLINDDREIKIAGRDVKLVKGQPISMRFIFSLLVEFQFLNMNHSSWMVACGQRIVVEDSFAFQRDFQSHRFEMVSGKTSSSGKLSCHGNKIPYGKGVTLNRNLNQNSLSMDGRVWKLQIERRTIRADQLEFSLDTGFFTELTISENQSLFLGTLEMQLNGGSKIRFEDEKTTISEIHPFSGSSPVPFEVDHVKAQLRSIVFVDESRNLMGFEGTDEFSLGKYLIYNYQSQRIRVKGASSRYEDEANIGIHISTRNDFLRVISELPD